MENIFWEDQSTVMERLMGRKIPDYYDTMYLDGYKPYEIVEAAHRAIYKHYMATRESQQDETPTTNVNFSVEMKRK